MRKNSEEYRTMMKVRKVTDAMDKVSTEMRESGLAEENLNAVKKELKYLGKFLGTSDLQTVLFITIIASGCDEFVSGKEIAEGLGVNAFTMLRLYQDLQVLVEKGFIAENGGGHGQRYRVTADALLALRHGRPPQSENLKNLPTHDIFHRMDLLFMQAHDQEISMGTVLLECDLIFSSNPENPFVKKCLDLKIPAMDPADRLAAYYMIHRAVDYSEVQFAQRELKVLMDNSFQSNRDEDEDILEENSALFEAGLVEYLQFNGLLNDNVLALTDFARTRLLYGLLNQHADTVPEEFIPSDELIPSGRIRRQELFYNEKAGRQMERLENLLQEENYAKVVQRMESTGFSKAFTVLFHGAPGTGKTAGVFELARRSGRDIWFVDQSKLRSKWHGESEKALRGMFLKYNEAVRRSKVCPILVLNECDSLMYRRIESPQESGDQLSNSMVNIILNELDRFEGILVATSNFTKGMDPAFERRMLFKVEFEKPGLEVRKKIWESKVRGLDERAAAELAESFDFSGGQIDNVARKATIEYILSGEEIKLESLKAFSEEERMNYKGEKSVGYKTGKM